MTPEQAHKLIQASELIDGAVDKESDDPKVISTWLRVAGDYCLEVADGVMEGGE